MTKISSYTLKGGKSSPSRISDVEESDEQIVAALKNKFGDALLRVKIGGKIIEVNK